MLKPLQDRDHPSQRLVVKAIVDFHPATIGQQQRQSAAPIHTARRMHRSSQPYLNQRAPPHSIAVWMGDVLKLLLQMTLQRAQCHPVTTAELAKPQTARSVQTRYSRNLRTIATLNHYSSFSAHDSSPSQRTHG
jgi:hypothetical protein